MDALVVKMVIEDALGKENPRVKVTFRKTFLAGDFNVLLSMAYPRREMSINLNVQDMAILSRANETGRWPKVWPEVVPGVVHEKRAFLLPLVKDYFEIYKFINFLGRLFENIKEA